MSQPHHPFNYDHRKIDQRVRMEVLTFERFWHPECAEPSIKRMREIVPPISRLRIFTGQWRPKKRFDITVDRCGQEASYYADWFEGNNQSNVKVYPYGQNWTSWKDRFGAKWHRFYRGFLDRGYDWEESSESAAATSTKTSSNQ